MSANCDVVVTFTICGQFGSILKTDSEHMVCNTYIFINSNLLSKLTEVLSIKIVQTCLYLEAPK